MKSDLYKIDRRKMMGSSDSCDSCDSCNSSINGNILEENITSGYNCNRDSTDRANSRERSDSIHNIDTM